MMRRMLARTLEDWEFEVTEAENGEVAWQQFQKHPFQLVLTDWVMPEMDGLQLLGELKEFEPSLPIIVMTAYGTIENAVQALRLGAYDYVTKPFETDELLDKVKEMISASS